MRIALATVVLAGLIFSANASQPLPTNSEFLVSTGAGFMLGEGRGAFYAMNYAVRKPLPGTVFGVALFDNPEDPAVPLRVETVIDADAKDIQLQSPPIHVLTNGKRYNVQLLLYTDAEHLHLLSTHNQEVLFALPSKLAPQISARYGVSVH